jgi:hypothetical protein
MVGGMKITTYIQLVTGLRMSGAMPFLPYSKERDSTFHLLVNYSLFMLLIKTTDHEDLNYTQKIFLSFLVQPLST